MFYNEADEFYPDELPYSAYPKDHEPILCAGFLLLRQLANPFRVSWILIKLGYEPLTPVQFSSPLALVGWTSPIYIYPNIIKYVYNLLKTFGVWTVFTTGIFANSIYAFIGEIFIRAFRRRTSVWLQSEIATRVHRGTEAHRAHLLKASGFLAETLVEEASLLVFLERFMEIMSLKSWEVIITHPFYVIMVRQIAALIGGETNYAWFHSAVRSIYRENGICGFFQGLVPRLLGELILLTAYYSSCRLIRYLLPDLGRQSTQNLGVFRLLTYFTLRSYTYSFELTGCIMTTHGAHLAGSTEANSFRNWLECKHFLTSTEQMSRGWLPFFRSHVQKKHLPT